MPSFLSLSSLQVESFKLISLLESVLKKKNDLKTDERQAGKFPLV